jgi:hypothetical protein
VVAVDLQRRDVGATAGFTLKSDAFEPEFSIGTNSAKFFATDFAGAGLFLR